MESPDFKAPTAIGISGHRSLTSNTIGILFTLEYTTAGIAMVKGVLVAKTRSTLMEKHTFADWNENDKKENIRLKNPILFE
jgi:hypothetical protein